MGRDYWNGDGMQLEQRYVEAFYNLEIDGDVSWQSILNKMQFRDLVMTNEELNRLYPRQSSKELVDASLSRKEGKNALIKNTTQLNASLGEIWIQY
jgi:hypothetical protein